MHLATRILPLALTLAIGVAPAAFARAAQSGTGAQSSTTMGTQVVLPGDMTMKGQIDHAYMEAVHAHDSMAKDMGEMAANHLSNIDLVLANLEKHSQQIDSATRARISNLRSLVSSAKSNLGDRTAGLKATSSLVGGFTSFYDQMAARPMGGGGGATRPELSTTEALAKAGEATAVTQTAIASRNWEMASLHVRDAIKHLDTANKASMAMKAKSADQTRVRTLHKEVQSLNSAIERRSTDAVKQAGALVNRIGMELSRVASSHMGGGAGM